MDYDFSRLSTRSFEQLIQSLAVKLLGSAVTVFGDGPDGGREASFEKLADYPSVEAPWSDYGVIQAKFRQRLSNATVDGRWVVSELEKELRKFEGLGRKLRKPRYYILATNVALSSVANKGAKDQVAALFERFRLKIGLRGYQVWDYDQLRTMLDQATEIRQAHLAWITPGDVLGALIKSIAAAEPGFRSTITSFIQKEIHSDELVRLGQAGATVKDSTPLASVFIDLPLDQGKGEDELHDSHVAFAVRQMVAVGADRLNRSALANPVANEAQNPTLSLGRIVYLGGPGQGKTTLSQFICQLHRATALAVYCADTMLPETRAAVSAIQAQAEKEQIPLPAMPRFPARIVLNNFARDLADGRVTSVLDYVCQRIVQKTQRVISVDLLREWLRAYPWLIVLDGLDEVPGASNRDDVVSAVRDLQIDINDLDADVLLIATTRPQGYNEEFSPSYFLHENLADLDVEHALRYAERLVRQRCGADEEKASVLLRRLERASAEEATARLMRSPLQVTIMALLVESLGLPPKERWRLFKEYFQVISRREKERAIPSAALLNAYEPDINHIHKVVGFQLQRLSEERGHTDAVLTEEEFAKIVRQRLIDEGHVGARLEALQHQITSAALERLVFLVSPRQGQIGFEIRSLQEFMAAEFLTDAGDDAVLGHLQAIAAASHWRNVFLFAAGKCFHDRQHLRRPLHTLLCELNEQAAGSAALNSVVLVGSQLALDVLEDGALLQQPQSLQLFARLALRLTELPPCEEHYRLASQYSQELEDVYRPVLDQATLAGGSRAFLGAWRVVVAIAEQNIGWASELVRRNWPVSEKLEEAILRNVDRLKQGALASRWVAFAERSPPGVVESVIERERGHALMPSGAPMWLQRLLSADDGIWQESVRLQKVGSLFELTYSPLSDLSDEDDGDDFELSLDDSDVSPDAHPGWHWLARAAKFGEEPNPVALANLVRDYQQLVDSGQDPKVRFVSRNIPWPLATALSSLKKGCSAVDLADRIERGEFGTRRDWFAAQARWQEEGVSTSDFMAFSGGQLLFGSDIAVRGFPVSPGSCGITHGEELPKTLEELINAWRALEGSASQAAIAGQIFFVASVMAGRGFELPGLFAEVFDALVSNVDRVWMEVGILAALPASFWLARDVENSVRKFGAFRLTFNHHSKEFGALERLCLSGMDDVHLMRCLAAACASGYRPNSVGAGCLVMPEAMPDELFAHHVIVALASESPFFLSASATASAARRCFAIDGFVEQVCSTVSRNRLSGEIAGEFLKNVYLQVPVEMTVDRQRILKAVMDVQKRRKSSL